jgi:hypothetical protein
MSNPLKSQFVTIFIIVVFVLDIIFVVLHFLYGQQVTFLNLDVERNIPTLYQGFKLIFISSLIAATWAITYKAQNVSWLQRFILVPYWFMFAYLALDELGQAHEGIAEVLFNRSGIRVIESFREFFVSLGFNAAPWLLFFIPIAALAVAYMISLAKYFYNQQTGKIYILALAILCFALVPVIEYWDTSKVSYSYRANVQNILLAAEEYLEMLGATLFLAFNLFLLRDKLFKLRRPIEQNANRL